jgi:hypothetical protein
VCRCVRFRARRADVSEGGGVVDKALMEADDPEFGGLGGFLAHGTNGMMVIPFVTLALLVVSFFVKRAGATRKAAIIPVLVVVQVALGIASHALPYAIVLHALAGLRIGGGSTESVAASPPATASVQG